MAAVYVLTAPDPDPVAWLLRLGAHSYSVLPSWPPRRDHALVTVVADADPDAASEIVEVAVLCTREALVERAAPDLEHRKLYFQVPLHRLLAAAPSMARSDFPS